MTFHPDGNYLLTGSYEAFLLYIHMTHPSGGEEGVLVIWQLATENKRFLPRIGMLYPIAK